RHHQFEAAQHISLFGYVLSSTEGKARRVYELRPPSNEFEYSLRLGFIRSELGRPQVSRRDVVPQISLHSLAEAWSKRWKERLYEIREEVPGARRFRLILPIAPELYKRISETEFYEDAIYQEELARDFMLPVAEQGENAIFLSDTLD